MAITFLETHGEATSTNPLTIAHTVPVGGNAAVYVLVGMQLGTAGSVASVTFDGLALSFLAGVTTDGVDKRIELWRRTASAAGGAFTQGASRNAVITYNVQHNLAIGIVISALGVDQATPDGTPVPLADSAAPASITVTNATNDIVLDGIISGLSDGPLTIGANQTTLANFGAVNTILASSYESTVGSAAMTWTQGVQNYWAMIGVSIHGISVTSEQAGYRWRDDNGTEVTASPLAAENISITRPTLQNTRLRSLVDTTGGDPVTAQRQLEWNRAAADAVWRALEVIGGAALAFGASGATSAATGSATAPIATYPTGITKGQQLILFVANKPDTVTPATPAGWTLLATATGGTGAQAADTGPTRGTLFGKEADGTETGTFTVTLTGNSSAGVKILRYAKTTGKVWSLAVASGSDSTAGTAWSAAASSNPDVRAGDILLVCSAPCSDCAVASQAVSQAGITFGTLVNRENLGITTGNDTKVLMDEFPVTGGTGGTGNPTLTFTASGTGSASESGVSLFLRIRQVDAPVVLSPSANIAAGGATATTAQLTAPGGHTFGGGDISDDTNPLPTLDIGLNQYYEDEYCLQETATALNTEVYQFRVTLNGTPLTTYTNTPTLTVGAASVAASLVVSLSSASRMGQLF